MRYDDIFLPNYTPESFFFFTAEKSLQECNCMLLKINARKRFRVHKISLIRRELVAQLQDTDVLNQNVFN